MRFSRTDADVHVPAGGPPEAALARITHLCIAAHQDDIEILAYDGICDCLEAPDARAFGGVVVTDGAGSPRSGRYAEVTDEAMRQLRRDEQRRAADLGGYALQLQLAHPSAAVKEPGNAAVVGDLRTVLTACRPQTLYLHNPADRHDTHVAVLLRTLEALCELPVEQRPERVLGVEVWRSLDWLHDEDKVALDSGRRPELAETLLRAFDSQISGGKRYDLATLGRRFSNATFAQSHATDGAAGITWAMDLSDLVAGLAPGKPVALAAAEHALAHVDRLRADVMARIARFG